MAQALEFEPAIGAGLAYSDNVNLVPVNEEDDIIAVGYLGATLSEKGGPLRLEASSGLLYQTYLDNTLDDERYPNLDLSAQWDQIRGRLSWDINDYITQRKINSLQPDRASNIQNTNVFTFGPSIRFQPSGAHSVSVNPNYSNFYYEDSDAGNQQYELSASWLYQMHPTRQVGLGGGVTAVDYDNEDLNPRTVSSDVYAIFSGTGASSSYTINLGATRVSRDGSDSTSGFNGDATWLRELTGHSSLRFHLASRITNASNSLLDSELNPDNGSFNSKQINSDVIRDNTMSIVYRRTGSRLDTTIGGQVQVVDSEETTNDRSFYQLDAALSYKVAPSIDGGLNAVYKYLNEDNLNRTDKEYSISGTVSYQLSRKLRTEFAVRYRDKSSDLEINEYTEAAVFIGLIWGRGSVPRTSVL